MLVSMDELKKAEEIGLLITVEYQEDKELLVAMAEQTQPVRRIHFLIYDNQRLISVSSGNKTIVMEIPTDVVEQINEHLDLV